VEELRQDAELLTPPARGRRVLRVADATERAQLRHRDPGAWQAMEPRPAIPSARIVEGWLVPMRDPNTSPFLLDLTNYYTMSPYTIRKDTDTVLADTADLPTGVATLDGVDYDMRGGVELRQASNAAVRARGNDLRSAASGIHLPASPIAALHVLLFAALPLPETTERAYANIRLHYRDGSEALLPIRTQREVPGLTDHDRPTPIGWASGDLASIGAPRSQLYSNPRLPNPHPERIIKSLDLEATKEGWSEPVFIAITAEPVEGTRSVSVIPAGDSGSNKEEKHAIPKH
jgi:hypothetical protein